MDCLSFQHVWTDTGLRGGSAKIKMTTSANRGWQLIVPIALLATAAMHARAAETKQSSATKANFRFSFGLSKTKPGFVQVSPTTIYSQELGYGFLEPVTLDLSANRSDFCSTKPFLFTLDVPEGNYRIKVTLGAGNSESLTTIKAESRRLLLEKPQTALGQFVTQTFTANVRHK